MPWTVALPTDNVLRRQAQKGVRERRRTACIMVVQPDNDTCDLADDDILAGRIMHGIKALRGHLGCSLHDALRAFAARYEVLRRQ